MSLEQSPGGAQTSLRELALSRPLEAQVVYGQANKFAELMADHTYGDLSKAQTKVSFNGEQIDIEIDDGRTAARLSAHILFRPDGTPFFVNTSNGGFLRDLLPEEISALIADLNLLSDQPRDINRLIP